jgi:sterol desaturase/sphingolipid hydroxylase (fatty acid hydroxylase superfamily)
VNTELPLQLAIFAIVIVAVSWWETAAPCRDRSVGRLARWPSNLAVVALNRALIMAIVPAGAVGVATLAAARGWGVMNLVGIPPALALLASAVLLDCVIYLQHVMFHAIPALWRIHRMHHADLDLDSQPVCASIRWKS